MYSLFNKFLFFRCRISKRAAKKKKRVSNISNSPNTAAVFIYYLIFKRTKIPNKGKNSLWKSFARLFKGQQKMTYGHLPEGSVLWSQLTVGQFEQDGEILIPRPQAHSRLKRSRR